MKTNDRDRRTVADGCLRGRQHMERVEFLADRDVSHGDRRGLCTLRITICVKQNSSVDLPRHTVEDVASAWQQPIRFNGVERRISRKRLQRNRRDLTGERTLSD